MKPTSVVLLLLLLSSPAHAVYYGQASRQVNHYWRLSEKQYKDVNATNDLPTTVAPTVADAFGDLYVMYNGRVRPLSCVAEDFCLKLYGKRSYRGMSANQVLLGYMLYTPEWDGTKLKSQSTDAQRAEQQLLIRQAVTMQLFRVFPESLPDSVFIPQIMAAIDRGNNAEAYDQIHRLRTYQQQCPEAAQLPTDQQFRAEQYFCRINQTLVWGGIALLTGLVFFVWFGVLFARTNRRRTPRWMTATMTTVDVALWLILTLLTGMRGWIGAYFPITNTYEYLHGAAWVALTLSLVVAIAIRRGSLRGLLTAGLTLVAGTAWVVCGVMMPHQMVCPATCSLLSAIQHVLLLLAYSVLAILLLMNLYAMVGSWFSANAHHLSLTIYHLSHLLLTPVLFLLVLAIPGGTAWTIVTLLIYAIALHWHPTHQRTVSLRELHGFQLYMILAFVFVLIPYLYYAFC